MTPASDPRQRTILTPEGLALTFTLASRGARLGALLLDLAAIALVLLLSVIALAFTAGGLANLDHAALGHGKFGAALQFLVILWLAVLFLLRNAWFLAFELGPRGATPGKRALSIRIAARDGARLTTEMVLARNLLRDIEIFLPIGTMVAAFGSPSATPVNWAAAAWFLLFALLPCFNRDALRAGDLIAGTWVVEAPRHRLEPSLAATARPTSSAYAFGPADLAAYGEYELQTLERVLREAQAEPIAAVAAAICAKIGWDAPGSDEARPFLDAYYTQLRGRLEQGMRFGQRKADKFG